MIILLYSRLWFATETKWNFRFITKNNVSLKIRNPRNLNHRERSPSRKPRNFNTAKLKPFTVYATASFSGIVTSRCVRNGTQIITSVMLYMNIICIIQWLFGGNSEILHYSDVFVRRPKLFKWGSTCQHFYREKMPSFLDYVTATLRALFAWRGSDVSYHLYTDQLTNKLINSEGILRLPRCRISVLQKKNNKKKQQKNK